MIICGVWQACYGGLGSALRVGYVVTTGVSVFPWGRGGSCLFGEGRTPCLMGESDGPVHFRLVVGHFTVGARRLNYSNLVIANFLRNAFSRFTFIQFIFRLSVSQDKGQINDRFF